MGTHKTLPTLLGLAEGTHGFDAPNLFAEIDKNAKSLVEVGNTQSIANTAWAC